MRIMNDNFNETLPPLPLWNMYHVVNLHKHSRDLQLDTFEPSALRPFAVCVSGVLPCHYRSLIRYVDELKALSVQEIKILKGKKDIEKNDNDDDYKQNDDLYENSSEHEKSSELMSPALWNIINDDNNNNKHSS